MLLRDAADLCGQRRREQRHLPLDGGQAEDVVDGIDETHLQHLVGFVQHHETQRGQIERTALEVVHHAPRCADDDMGAATKRIQLWRVALAAVDRQHMQAGQLGGVLLERLGDLDREFTGRHEHQDLRFAARDIEHRQERQRECGGLAGAGLCLADEVLASEQHGDGGGLDGRRRLVADIRQGGEHGLRETEIREGHRGIGGALGHLITGGVAGKRGTADPVGSGGRI